MSSSIVCAVVERAVADFEEVEVAPESRVPEEMVDVEAGGGRAHGPRDLLAREIGDEAAHARHGDDALSREIDVEVPLAPREPSDLVVRQAPAEEQGHRLLAGTPDGEAPV